MDNTIDTGDPWDLGEQEQEQEHAPPSGGMNPLAEGTGLFGKKQPPAEEPAAEADAELPEPALPDPIASIEDAAADADIESALQELEAVEPLAPVDEVDHVLQELEAATAADGDSFELIPPPAPDQISPMYETYSPDLAADAPVAAAAPVEDDAEEPEPIIPPGPPDAGDEQYDLGGTAAAVPAADEPAIDEAVILEPAFEEAPIPEPVVEAPVAEEPVAEPVVEVAAAEAVVEEPVVEAPAEDEPVFEIPELTEPVEIEFGKPNVPEGSEQPTGKATQTVSEETMTRPALLTTDAVAGAKIAPVDMVIAVASVHSPSDVADAMAAVLDELRDRCADAGGDVVIGVKTEISSAGDSIMVTAAGTAVSLL